MCQGWLPSMDFGVSMLLFHSHCFSVVRTEGEHAPPLNNPSILEAWAPLSPSLPHPSQMTCPSVQQDGRVTIFHGVGVSAWGQQLDAPRGRDLTILFSVVYQCLVETWHIIGAQ